MSAICLRASLWHYRTRGFDMDAMTRQIIIGTVSSVLAMMIVNWMQNRNRPPQAEPPPPAQQQQPEKNWWEVW